MKRIKPKRTRSQNKQRKLHMEPLEHRVCLAASVGWDGPGLGAASLSYYIGNVPASVGLQQAQVETAIETALGAWAQVADVTFTQTTLARQADSLDITFTSIDGSGGILAQAYLPDDVNRGRLAGDIEFDLADPWEIGNDAGSTAFDLVYVAAHEIGHALGLDHLNVAGSVMRPSVSPSQAFTTLSTADGNAVLGLYAAAPGDSSNTGGTGGEDNDTTDDGSSSGGNDSAGEEIPHSRGGNRWGRFGRFGGRLPRFGRSTANTIVAAPAYHNISRPADVNGDDNVSSLDALMIINFLNTNGPQSLGSTEGEAAGSFAMVDVSGDERVTAVDALMVINELNAAAPTTIAIATPADDEIPDTDMPTDETVSTDATNPTEEEVPVDDTSAEVDDTDSTSTTDAEQEMNDTGADDQTMETESNDESDVDDSSSDGGTSTESDDGNDEQSDDETMVDDGPLEYKHDGCHGGRIDVFARFDTNEDGLLTVDEVPEMLWARLIVADTDQNAAITPAELEALAREHHRPDPFAKFDANEDGALTVDEVPERLWNRLSQADADQDGAVTAAELAAARDSDGEGHGHHGRHHHAGHHGHRNR